MFFGGNIATSSPEALRSAPQNPISMNGISPSMYMEGDRLYVDVSLNDGSQSLPVEIKRGVFTVQPPNWDRNSNATAFEVVNEKLVPVFQYIIKSPFKVQINGIFPAPRGGFVLVDESRALTRPVIPNDFRLKRIFKYPSWRYPGQYTEFRN